MAAIRKTCAHARGKHGAERMRAWRRCGCVWRGDLYIDGQRRYPSLGPDLRAS